MSVVINSLEVVAIEPRERGSAEPEQAPPTPPPPRPLDLESIERRLRFLRRRLEAH